MVDVTVRLVTLDVLVAILDGSDAQHDEDRYDYQTWRYGGKLGEELQNCYECKETRGCGEWVEAVQTVETYIFAMRLNCSRRFLGRNVMIVYLDEMTWLVG